LCENITEEAFYKRLSFNFVSHKKYPCETCIIINDSKKIISTRNGRVLITTPNVTVNYFKRFYRGNDNRIERQATLLSQRTNRTNMTGLNRKI